MCVRSTASAGTANLAETFFRWSKFPDRRGMKNTSDYLWAVMRFLTKPVPVCKVIEFNPTQYSPNTKSRRIDWSALLCIDAVGTLS